MIPDLIQEYPEGYYDYLAQCYQEEDEQMRKDFEELEAEYWVDYYKNNF